jgi:hypothetical protein
VLFVHVGLWDPSKYDVDEYERYIVYFFDGMLRAGGGEQFVVIMDMHGSTLIPDPSNLTPDS